MVAVEWEREKIGNLFDFKNGLNKGKEFFGYGTPIINYTDVYNHRGITKANVNGKVSLENNEINRYAVKKGDVFFTRTSETPEEVGISSVLLEDIPNCVFSGFVLRGRPKTDRLLPEYCQYCFSAPQVRNEIISRCTYTTRALTNGKQLSAIDIPVPEKSEQTFLATALSDMDALIDGLRRLITKKKNIRQGAMQELLTGERRLPGFEGEWTPCILKEISAYRKVKANTQKQFFVSTENMLPNFMGVISYEDESFIKGNRFVLGDTLIANIRPYLKKIWFSSFEGVCSPDVLVICGNNLVTPEFLNCLIANEMFISYVMNGGVEGSKMPRGNKAYIMNYPVAIPTIEEQKAISTLLFDMDAEIRSLESKLKKYENIKSGMMDKLLTGQIRLV